MDKPRKLKPTWETAWALVLGQHTEHLAADDESEEEDGFSELVVGTHFERYKEACRVAATIDGELDREKYEEELVLNVALVQGAFINAAVTYWNLILPDRSRLEHWTFLVEFTRKTLERAAEHFGELDADEDSGPAT